jgi:hypothetical protein
MLVHLSFVLIGFDSNSNRSKTAFENDLKENGKEKGKRKSPAASRDHSLNSKCIT